ncbi:hypothetical protein AVEN_268739-1 [Araneus ventricosus]|uniref:Uncharacterized protein n=1 Tax=Araneus ventricosus TaxID=182803 RepID=A0A4Y2H314_ARAVE|nr:hypothetical protein AVEN_268739-1 [Araneus ventricosus]
MSWHPLSKLPHHTNVRPSQWTLNAMGESMDVGCGHHTNRRTFDSLPMIYRVAGPNHSGSSVESCFEPGILWLQRLDLITRPPRSKVYIYKVSLTYSAK